MRQRPILTTGAWSGLAISEDNMTHYAIQMADGSVAIMQTVGDAKPDECIAKWPPEERAKAVSYKQIDPNTIPTDQTYRDAWVIDGESIAVHPEKAEALRIEWLAIAKMAEDVAAERARIKAAAIEAVKLT